MVKKLVLTFSSFFLLSTTNAQENGIINNSNSEHVALKSIDIGDCQWTEGFWADKFDVCENVMMPHMGTILKGDIGHSLNNFKIAAGLKEGKHQGMHWHDGDYYKWLEAAMYIYAINKDEKILKDMDESIAIIGKAQESSGYLQTQIQLNKKNRKRYSERRFHEMYNSGHLMTSACIHHRISGQTNFLDIAIKQADYLYQEFADRPLELARFGFNQTQIMGLVEMYRTTKDKKYLELAEKFVNARGTIKPDETDPRVRYKMIGDMTQERKPIRKETEAVGHAVLALYFYAGAADIAAETGEKELVEALDRLWSSVVDKKMYVTGACGQTHHGASKRQDVVHEAFIDEYMMPNLTAYNETCANICNSMFSYRMLGIHGESKYADIMELVLFNSALSGISIEGKDYFYVNPLRKIHNSMDYSSTESATREPYINCFCCPPNLVRTIAKMSGWAYSLSNNGVAVNLYGGNKLETKLLDGSKLELQQVTNYPWEGRVDITLNKCKKEAFDMMLRIPEWAHGTTVTVNEKEVDAKVVEGKYLTINRNWKKGDKITVDMPMNINKLEGNPRIEEVRNQIAIKRGPVVYCVESPDLPKDTEILDVYMPFDSDLKAEYRSDFLGGVSTISTELKIRKDKKDGMYHETNKPQWETHKGQLVPYFAWANRGKSEMTVWMPVMW